VPTVGNGTFQPNCQLAAGNDSTAVELLQVALNKCYGYDLTEDGDFGPLTQSAVEGMQSRLGISVGRDLRAADPHCHGIPTHGGVRLR
jgi:peptidoglycan hydrolase-like protein with peptidoglycan-binding domain